MNCEVLVVGGGPAGSVFAATLAREGKHVCILDPYVFQARVIGEALPGPAVALLRSIGFAPSSAHGRLGGVCSCWGSAESVDEDYFARPQGASLRLDRARFNAELAAWARESVASVIFDRCRSVAKDGEGFVIQTHNRSSIRCGWLVDATGRRSAVSRRLGGRRGHGAQLFSVYGLAGKSDAPLTRLLVETTHDGWWYAIGLPEGQTLAAFHSNASVARSLLREPAHWHARLRSTGLISKHCNDAMSDKTLAIADASSFYLANGYGTRWLAIGDAAATHDPITSQGLHAAIHDGLYGARAVAAALDGNTRAIEEFDSHRLARYRFIEANRKAAYWHERRWPDAQFWVSQR